MDILQLEWKRSEIIDPRYRSGIQIAHSPFNNPHFKLNTIQDFDTHLKFIDFIINGNSLINHLSFRDRGLISSLWSNKPDINRGLIQEILGLSRPSWPNERVPFYICSHCGDIGCGAITARVSLLGNSIKWYDFVFHNDISPETDPDIGFFEPIMGGPFIFSLSTCLKEFCHV